LQFGDRDRHLYEDFVLILLEEFSHVIKEKDHKGHYLLHYACANGVSESVVLKLLTEFPQASKEKDENDCYPLHLACRYKQSENVIFN
jgi:ankyrin repeat protein